mgnify:CR=1 FL=1
MSLFWGECLREIKKEKLFKNPERGRYVCEECQEVSRLYYSDSTSSKNLKIKVVLNNFFFCYF